MKTEYSLNSIILEQVRAGMQCKELEDFTEFLEKYFGEVREDFIVLNLEMTELREKALIALTSKQRTKATELIVKQVEKDHFIYTTRDDIKSEMWIYNDGIYLSQGKTFVKEFCRKILGHAYTTQFVNEVIGKIEADTFIEQDQFFRNNYPFEVPLQDGILNIKTKEISPFSPRKIFFNKLPINYSPNKDCPKITEHFKTILREEDDVKVMFEIFGYSLMKDSFLEKAFMFVGWGRNGKTKTLELIKRFLGVDNCSGLPLKSLTEDQFTIHEVFGKMVNLAGDLGYTELKDTGILRMLIGRDLIQSKRKFLRDLKFINYAKLIFACNELPRIYDMTDGFWTKWILLEFPYKFITQKEMDELPKEEKKIHKIINPDIIQEIITPDELSGLLNRALEGLARILKNKDFSYSKGTVEVKDLWIRKSDSFMAFCLDFIDEDPELSISKRDLRRQYYQYCKEHKLKGSSDKAIKITLENMFGVIDSQHGISDDRERYWEGIKFKVIQEPIKIEKISNAN